MPFQPGNKLAATKAKPFRDALRKEIADCGEDSKGLRDIARAVIREALTGNMNAATFIADRLDGKVPQPIAGDDENPLTLIHRIESIIVDPANSDGESLPAPVESEPI